MVTFVTYGEMLLYELADEPVHLFPGTTVENIGKSIFFQEQFSLCTSAAAETEYHNVFPVFELGEL